ncbi:MAG: transglycosylase SLT domain-containing protein [Burkholderiales bacterium]
MNGTMLHAARAYAALKSLFALFGLAAVAAFFLPPAKQPEASAASLARFVAEPPVAAVAAAEGPGTAQVADAPAEREQRAVGEFIAKRYRIADAAAAHFVSIAYRAGAEHRVDPLLVLAVMAIESRYNPVAESFMGAKGLMQVIPKYHLEKLMDHGGEHAVLDPEVNIQVGAQILREYQRRFGDTETALQMYAGALDEPTSQYANKVLAEKARLDALRIRARKQTAQSA